MDIDKLQEKLNQLRSAAELKLSEANKAYENDDFETAGTLTEEADALLKKADALNSQISRMKKAQSLKPASQKDAHQADDKSAVRLPFDDADDAEDANASTPQEPVASPIYTMKYGNLDLATRAVINDIFGRDYYEKREAQQRAFAKYLRYGQNRMSASEWDSLREIIYLPETVKSEILQEYSVQEILANKATQQEASLEMGGALVPEDWRAEVIKRVAGSTIVRGRARVITTTRDAIEWPKLEGGNDLYTSAVRVTWVDEVPADATAAQTNFTVGTLRVPVHTVMARTDVSRNLLEDSGVPVMSLLAELFSEAMAIDEDARFLTGTGGGTPRGILGNRSGAEETPETGIAEANSGAAAALTADGLIDLVYKLDLQYMNNAIMVGAKNTFRDIRKLKDGNSDYLWARGIERGAPPTVLGVDFFMNQNMPAVSANAYPLVYGDFRGYLIADRVGMTVERVSDTTTTGQNKVAVFARRRLGGQVIQPYFFVAQKVSA